MPQTWIEHRTESFRGKTCLNRIAYRAVRALFAMAMSCPPITGALAAGDGPNAVPVSPTMDPAVPCDHQAQSATCVLRVSLPNGAGKLAYYVSRLPTAREPSRAQDDLQAALLVMHGHPRDAARSFNAGLAAVRNAGLQQRVLVVAPLFQVSTEEAQRCHTPGEMAAAPGDALWQCGTWLAGKPSTGAHPITSSAAIDALVLELKRQWPGLRTITLAGFSAGAQLLQHQAGFAAAAPPGVRLRYVVADPGTWLYFDAVRPQARRDGKVVADTSACGPAEQYPGECAITMQTPAPAAVCPGFDQWKYGVADLPAYLGRDAAEARQRYRATEMAYLAGALDSGPGPGTYNRIMDHSCAAELQGSYRLQRAQGYAAYDRQVLKPDQPHRLTIVPDCAHDVACVLPSSTARPALFDGLVR